MPSYSNVEEYGEFFSILALLDTEVKLRQNCSGCLALNNWTLCVILLNVVSILGSMILELNNWTLVSVLWLEKVGESLAFASLYVIDSSKERTK